MRIAGRRQRKVALVFSAVAGLFERAQHKVTQDALLRLAFDLGNKLLIVARCKREIIGSHHHVRAYFAPVPPALHDTEFLHWDRSDTERITEVRGDFLKFHHSLRIGLLVNPEERWNARLLQMRGNG